MSNDAFAVDEDKDVQAWLRRNARRIDVQEAKGTESWDRVDPGLSSSLVTAQEARGHHAITLPDSGNTHECIFVESPDGTTVGACDCTGFVANDHPCAHLVALGTLDVMNKWSPPTDSSLVGTLEGGRKPDYHPDREQGDVTRYEEPPEPSTDGGEGDVVPVESGESEDTPAPPEREETVPQRDDAFASPMPDVPSEYVMQLDGETYIRRAGYARLAKQAGFRVEISPLVQPEETEPPRAKYQAVVKDGEGEIVGQDIGTSGPPDVESMADAEAHLDELAITRAKTRALSWATGEGLTALSELPEHANEGVSR